MECDQIVYRTYTPHTLNGIKYETWTGIGRRRKAKIDISTPSPNELVRFGRNHRSKAMKTNSALKFDYIFNLIHLASGLPWRILLVSVCTCWARADVPQFTGYFTIGGSYKYFLKDRAIAAGAELVGDGGNYKGYRVISFDKAAETLLLENGSILYWVPVGKSGSKTSIGYAWKSIRLSITRDASLAFEGKMLSRAAQRHLLATLAIYHESILIMVSHSIDCDKALIRRVSEGLWDDIAYSGVENAEIVCLSMRK